MRKINKIWYVAVLVVGLSILISISMFKSGIEGEAWFRYASKFDQARNKMVASGGAIQYFNKAGKLAKIFLQAKQPTEAEIIYVLKSPDRGLQRVGLVAMSLKPIETDQIIGILFEFLQDSDRDFRCYASYSLYKFTEFPESKKADLAKQLLEIINKEEDMDLRIQEFYLLAKVPSDETALFLTEQLMKEGEEKENRLIRLVAFNALKEMGNSYYDEAKKYVNTHGSPEVKKELLERENFWEEMNTANEKK